MRLCILCGQVSDDVTPSVALLAPTADRGERYERMDRCKDRLGCRDRVQAQGDTWPIAVTTLSSRMRLPAERRTA